MSTAADLWAELQQLKAADAPMHQRGRVYERWFAQAIREGNDPSRLWPGHIPTEARGLPWVPPCTCGGCTRWRNAA